MSVAGRPPAAHAAWVGEGLEGLAACALAYGRAVEDLVAQEAGSDAETLRRSEAVLATRVSLFRCLVDAGWEPTEDVRQEMAHDLRLLGEASRQGRGDGRA